MSLDFNRTLRALERQRQRLGKRYLWLGLAAAPLAARVPVYELSVSVRLEVDAMGSPVDALVTGRVVASQLGLGRQVSAGEVLVELDSQLDRQEQLATEARIGALEQQLAARRQELQIATELLEQKRSVA